MGEKGLGGFWVRKEVSRIGREGRKGWDKEGNSFTLADFAALGRGGRVPETLGCRMRARESVT
jgi:hypothetical protein